MCFRNDFMLGCTPCTYMCQIICREMRSHVASFAPDCQLLPWGCPMLPALPYCHESVHIDEYTDDLLQSILEQYEFYEKS